MRVSDTLILCSARLRALGLPCFLAFLALIACAAIGCNSSEAVRPALIKGSRAVDDDYDEPLNASDARSTAGSSGKATAGARADHPDGEAGAPAVASSTISGGTGGSATITTTNSPAGMTHETDAPAPGSSGASGPQPLPAAGTPAMPQPTVPDPNDLRFTMDITVPTGAELLKCIYAQVPSDRGVIAVPRVESHYTPGSHHLLAYRSNLTSIPLGSNGVWDCSDGLWQVNERGSYYEAQQPDENRALPPGIAHEFEPGEVLILQAHYLNPSDKALDAHVDFIMHTMDVAQVQQEAGTIFFNDINIQVPAHARSSVSMTCTLPKDIQLALLWSHMHRRGVHFVATTDDADAATKLGTLYDEVDWSEPKERVYPSDPPVVLHAGTHITFSCEYQNDSNTNFVFGNSAEDNEMCILHGMYWPRMPTSAEQCSGGSTSRKRL